MRPNDLKELASLSESETLEFKSRLPATPELATLISAFVNTNGGTIIVGVQEGGRILGIDNAASARLRIEQAIKAVSPSVHVETETVIVDGKSVLVVTVPKGREPPYLTRGRVFQRSGHLIVPITSQVLSSNIREHVTSSDELSHQIERLSRTIETLNQRLIRAESWRPKIRDMVVGGIIGAVISAIIAFLISLF